MTTQDLFVQNQMQPDEIPVGRAEDLRGQKFGRLIPLYRVKNNTENRVQWKCLCDCGNMTIILAKELKAGKRKSCGCLNTGKNIHISSLKHEDEILLGKAENLAGQKFGRLTALYRTFDQNDKTMWMCLCECGNKVKVAKDALKAGETKSCGCYRKEVAAKKNFVDKSNQKFGHLTVLCDSGQRTPAKKILWKCQCDCGNIINVTTGDLTTGHIQSCGCVKSRGQKIIIQLFLNNNIPFKTEKCFDTCRFKDTNKLARFDFYIPNRNYLIEYDGEQHYVGWHNDEDDLFKNITHDEYKNQWCKENNIPLIRIPYWHLDKLTIEDLLLETTTFRVV